ncbi:MAG: hypothetical protein CMP18_01565 [Rickettsiales bacterium]|nr:hypothetical protein [Rickettsiales bacterium]|tara:strand:- start:9465 stop:9896 length:432 start_codon:yes stop_codon:yes gene_type:complete
MDYCENKILKKFKKQHNLKIILLSSCYIIIAVILVFFITIAFKKSSNIKIIKSLRNNKENFTTEKIMINPSMKIKYNNNVIYNINAKKAFHKNDDEIILENIIAKSKIGTITANKLEVKENGNRLIFSDEPILIIKKDLKNKK